MLIVENGGTVAATLGVLGMIVLCMRVIVAVESEARAHSATLTRRRNADRAPFNDLR